MKHIVYIWLVSLSVAATASAQSMTLEECDRRFNEQLDLLKQQHREKVEGMQRSYLAALLRFENEAKQRGDLTGVQAARREIGRVEDLEKLSTLDEFEPSDHERIRHMRGVMRERLDAFGLERAQGVAGLADSVGEYVDRTSMELTQQNKIDQAVAWRKWSEKLDENQEVLIANRKLNRRQAVRKAENPPPRAGDNLHDALKGTPVKLKDGPPEGFPDRAAAYRGGSEPPAKDKKIGHASIPNAKGMGGAYITSKVKLVDQSDTLASSRGYYSHYKHETELFVPRLEFNPLLNKPLGRTLVVFDLYKRGSGSKRELITTDSILLPPIEAQRKVVVDAKPYAYETQKYRGYFTRYESSTAEEFYGYIVTIFDENGEMIFQRSTERALNDLAREHPPR